MPTHFDGDPRQVRALNAYIKLMRATETLAARMAEDLGRQGLTLGQLAVLEALLHLGPLSQRDLGRKLLRSSANVTTVVDNLEREGFVRRARCDADRRIVTVSLTPDGKRRIRKVFPAHAQLIADLMGALSPSEQDTLGELCKRLGGAAALAGER